LAVINGRTFANGEQGTIKAGKTSVTIICYEISDASVVVGIAGTAERKELILSAKH